MNNMDFDIYNSVFSYRYGSDKMRKIFSERHKYEIWRKIWVALARAQNKAGLVSKNELDDLVKNQNKIDIERIYEIEKETKHDVVAAIREFAQVAKIGGGKIHLGATSMDIHDNGDILKIKEAVLIVEDKLKNLMKLFAQKIEEYADVPCIGYTHLQAAEPITVGYRLANYAQDLFDDYKYCQFIKENIKGKGMKGAVGTGASYTKGVDEAVMKELGIKSALISNQIISRQMEYWVLTCLSSIGNTLAKFSADLRILQSTNFGEWSEPFAEKQVGSSAMPFKRNPINSEKICSLSRYLTKLVPVAIENQALSYLERTLDDSANRRIIIPEAFLALDEILETANKLIDGLVINLERVQANLIQYAPFAATEKIILESVKKGANRQEMHELIREISMKVWGEIQMGEKNRMKELLYKNKVINKFFKESEFDKLFDVTKHLGEASERAMKCAKMLVI
jgi:adenylosuccinate lyase